MGFAYLIFHWENRIWVTGIGKNKNKLGMGLGFGQKIAWEIGFLAKWTRKIEFIPHPSSSSTPSHDVM